MFSYNTSEHEGTEYSPHELIFDRPARQPSQFPPFDQIHTYDNYVRELALRVLESLETTKSRKIRLRSRRPFF